jgi:hypothetical protein
LDNLIFSFFTNFAVFSHEKTCFSVQKPTLKAFHRI